MNEIKEYDENNNEVYYKDNTYENWSEYDENNNLIHYKSSDGFEYWREYDENNRLTHCKDTCGYEKWYKYDKDKKIEITEQEFKQIKRKNEKQELELGIINIHGHFHNAKREKWEKLYKSRLTNNHYLLALEYVNYRPILLETAKKGKFVKKTKEIKY